MSLKGAASSTKTRAMHLMLCEKLGKLFSSSHYIHSCASRSPASDYYIVRDETSLVGDYHSDWAEMDAPLCLLVHHENAWASFSSRKQQQLREQDEEEKEASGGVMVVLSMTWHWGSEWERGRGNIRMCPYISRDIKLIVVELCIPIEIEDQNPSQRRTEPASQPDRHSEAQLRLNENSRGGGVHFRT